MKGKHHAPLYQNHVFNSQARTAGLMMFRNGLLAPPGLWEPSLANTQKSYLQYQIILLIDK